MRTTDEILNQIFIERNSSKNTQKSYRNSVKRFEEYFDTTIAEVLAVAEDEDEKGVPWKKSQLKQYIVQYRSYVYSKYKSKTANQYLTIIISIFRHFELIVPQLPYYRPPAVNKSPVLLPEDIPDRELLKEVVSIGSPLFKAVVLFMSSTGMSRVDTTNLTIQDYLEATSEYHNQTEDIKLAIREMEQSEEYIIPMFRSNRQKTGVLYVTFASHEAVNAVNSYLKSRVNITITDGEFNETPLQLNDPLFDISYNYLGEVFGDMNDEQGYGKSGNYRHLTAHMLRRYHATQLGEAGLSDGKIDILQGRTPKSVLNKSYLKIKTDVLKEDYIRCLPYLVVEDINKVKTKLDVEVEKNKKLEAENKYLNNNITSIKERLDNLEDKASKTSWEDVKEYYL